MIRDPRSVERKKPGQKKARKKFTWWADQVSLYILVLLSTQVGAPHALMFVWMFLTCFRVKRWYGQLCEVECPCSVHCKHESVHNGNEQQRVMYSFMHSIHMWWIILLSKSSLVPRTSATMNYVCLSCWIAYGDLCYIVPFWLIQVCIISMYVFVAWFQQQSVALLILHGHS